MNGKEGGREGGNSARMATLLALSPESQAICVPIRLAGKLRGRRSSRRGGVRIGRMLVEHVDVET